MTKQIILTNANGQTITAEYTEEAASALMLNHGIDIEQEIAATLKYEFDTTDNTKK